MAVPYLGTLSIKLRTFTSSYASPGGGSWQFYKNSMQPMDHNIWRKGSDSIDVGVFGSIFDLTGGITGLAIGNKNGTLGTDGSSGLIWYKGQLSGWIYNAGFASDIPQYYVPLNGNTFSDAILNGMPGLILPTNVPNTSQPNGFAGGNWITTKGIYSSYIENLLSHQANFDIPSGTVTTQSTPFVGFSSSRTFDLCIPFNGLNCIRSGNASNVNDVAWIFTNSLTTTDTVVTTQTFQNPPGNLDVNSLMNTNSGLCQVSYSGFTQFGDATVTVGTKTLNGYGILVLPNMSGYFVLEIIPVDATAATWNQSLIGSIVGKFDTTGALWLHRTNLANTLFVSAGQYAKLLPVFPPIALPPPIPDFDGPILPYREEGAKS